MVDLNQLWIGDKVKILSSEKIGIFLGISMEGKGRIKVLDKVFLVKSSNLQLIDDIDILPDVDTLLGLDNNVASPSNKRKMPNIVTAPNNFIDLHIEKLAPHLLNSNPAHLLTYQIQECTRFIEEMVHRNMPYFTIVHGKGQGVLKAEIEQLLKSYPQIKFLFSKNDGGAVEVWI